MSLTTITFFLHNTSVCMLGKVATISSNDCLSCLQGISMLLWPFFVITQLPSCTSPERDGFVPLQQEPQLMMNTVAPAAVQPRFPQVCGVKQYFYSLIDRQS